ncbi:PUA domain-containing protein [Natranaeroarchaeum aerophilus]|uniref:Pseudouridine synthase n=1 Tax=Natranaeroarchaeum aerophilus TaxID=2917711 RepID=A0AAE3FSN8_9EURY|nr:PUA domain-containing protein [Natranaeroarchaeum aerophilus]MCL9814584.1 pseudouridine synthase [Natranaeroarchaeum aerophilus]
MSDDADTGLGEDGEHLRTVAGYQFGGGAGPALFPEDGRFTIKRSSSGRPQQVIGESDRIVSLNVDGRYTLGIEGGKRLLALADPRNRVVVGDESEPFVRDGKNVFAKFVDRVDGDLRPGDEALVVHENGDLLAVGRAELSADAMCDFETGMAVKVREGATEES